MCGFYMSIGVSWDEYWNGDNTCLAFYLDAFERKRQYQSEMMWLQGAYVYEAIKNLFPVLNPLSKKKDPYPYISEPFKLYEDSPQDEEEIKGRKKQRKQSEGARNYMSQMMNRVNNYYSTHPQPIDDN